ncbi:PE domain-containing protein [Tsukamurella asaccharolytica]|uniref:PE domain-containing protein n=1 Tax=Tsukamurella asaccharolytica TaxID=2592067 RepID=A0A5C5RAN0_9ACTN|nr:PE family protein [Tsukamurella asaccharolytica]TWS19155.1 PE domain-containing protein [Tsukamurella asaccharolytica]
MAGSKLSMDPQEAREIARGIERIVEDLRGAQKRFQPHATPAATGRDEVSVTVARTAQRMGENQVRAAEVAVADLRRLGEAVSGHVTAVQRGDSELGATLGLVV